MGATDITTQNIEAGIASPAFEPRYQNTYVAPVKARNASAYASYLKSKKLQDISKLNDKMTYDNTIADINNYIKYAKEDFIAWVAKNDMNLANALQTASESYGAWNLLGSGIQISRTTDMIDESQLNKDLLATEKKNTMDRYNEERARTMAKYEQITKPINQMQDEAIKYKPSTPTGRAEAYSTQLATTM